MAKEKEAVAEKLDLFEPVKVSKEEYERRSKLDVSDKEYINVSLDHYVVAE